MAVLGKFKGLSIIYIVTGTTKRHILGLNDVFWRIFRRNPFRDVGCSELQESKKAFKTTPWSTSKSRIWGTETPELITTKFCMPGAFHDVITHANFCEDRLRGFGVARGRIFAFSIDLLRRLLNTLALPCECVIGNVEHHAQKNSKQETYPTVLPTTKALTKNH